MVADVANSEEAYTGVLRLKVALMHLKPTSPGAVLALGTPLGARTLGEVGNIVWRVVEARLSSFRNKSFRNLQFFSLQK